MAELMVVTMVVTMAVTMAEPMAELMAEPMAVMIVRSVQVREPDLLEVGSWDTV
jgi:hypothetical protein